MKVRINEEWRSMLAEVWDSPEFERLAQYIREEYSRTTVYPPAAQIFSAFDECPFSNVKVVIIGQDPYHGVGQANGLAFSVNPQVELPPSLVNIFKEIENETGKPMPCSGDLTRWARQGVLLINSTLTVRAHAPLSHSQSGWEKVTDAAISSLSAHRKNIVFLLWGAHARRKAALIDQSKHLILEAPHPSPLSAYRGFFGCGHFIKTNQYLNEHGLTEIDW